MSELPLPEDRTEELFHALASGEGSGDLPQPESRIDHYLKYLIENGGGVTGGYFDGTNFYKDAEMTELITPKEGTLYLDKDGHKLYVYDSGVYIALVGGNSDGALVFEDIEEMVEAVNDMSKGALSRGQNIYLLDTGVPDLWCAQIVGTSVPYTYTTDEAFVSDLQTNKKVQIGYHYIAQLESGADLSNYYNKQQADATFQKKADMLPEQTYSCEMSDGTSKTLKLYAELV